MPKGRRPNPNFPSHIVGDLDIALCSAKQLARGPLHWKPQSQPVCPVCVEIAVLTLNMANDSLRRQAQRRVVESSRTQHEREREDHADLAEKLAAQ